MMLNLRPLVEVGKQEKNNVEDCFLNKVEISTYGRRSPPG
jgi:hypothetical protein